MILKLSDKMRKFAEARAKEKGCASLSEYVELLVREDQQRTAEVDRMLIEGVESGYAELTPELWEEIGERARARLAARAASGE